MILSYRRGTPPTVIILVFGSAIFVITEHAFVNAVLHTDYYLAKRGKERVTIFTRYGSGEGGADGKDYTVFLVKTSN